MSRPVCAFAPRLATSFVSLDEGASQNRFERRQLTYKGIATFSQRGGGFFSYIYQTTCTTGLILEQSNRRLSTFILSLHKMFQKSNQLEKRFCLEPAWWEAERVINRRISPVRPLARNAETTALALAENQRIDTGYTPLLEHFAYSGRCGPVIPLDVGH
jgi:hypothetical protein